MRKPAVLALTVSLGLGLAACGEDDASIDAPIAVSGPPSATAPAPTPSAGSTAASAATTGGDPAVADTIATGLEAPWGLGFLPDGSAVVAERDTAKIKRIAGGGAVTTLGTVPGVRAGGEGGLLGLAVAPPDTADTPVLYAYFTAAEDNRIVRIPLDDGKLGRPEVILDGIERAGFHNGGRLAFGPDGMLYAGTGDAGRTSSAQDPNSLNGKILRMTPDGEAPEDNPTEGSLVYSLGHRNVQGLAFDSDGRLWASEFGQNTFDELNLIEAGKNYGWPEVEGEGTEDGKYTSPAQVWSTDDASPSGIAIAGGSVWMAALKGARLWEIPLDGDSTGEPKAWFEGEYGRLRTVVPAPDGSLWVITNNTDGRGSPKKGDDRILRVAP